MPVYDCDHTTNYIAKEIYDCDHTTNFPVAYAYDCDHTSNLLVYQNKKKFYPGTAVQGAQSGGSWGTFYANTSNSSGGWARAYIPVNLTNISNIKITYTYSKGTYTQLFIGVCSNFAAHAYEMNLNGYIKKSAEYLTGVGASNATNKTVTLNVSDLSGTYYIGIQSYSGSSVDAGITASISAIEEV